MAKTITYLFPQAMRRGSPVIEYVSREVDRWQPKPLYCLGVYHLIRTLEELKKKPPYDGVEEEYAGRSESCISRELYHAFLKEAKRNEKRFARASSGGKRR